MDAIEKLDPACFAEYLKNSKNTICGRHPIGVLLNVSNLGNCEEELPKKPVNLKTSSIQTLIF